MSLRYSSSRSISRDWKPSARAAAPVVPVPAKISITKPSGGVIIRTSQRISAIGFTVGWVDPFMCTGRIITARLRAAILSLAKRLATMLKLRSIRSRRLFKLRLN